MLLDFDSGLSSYAPNTKGTGEESAQEVPLVNWKDLSPGVLNNELESPNSLRDNGWENLAGVMDSRGCVGSSGDSQVDRGLFRGCCLFLFLPGELGLKDGAS